MPKGKSYDLAIDYWKIAAIILPRAGAKKIRHLLQWRGRWEGGSGWRGPEHRGIPLWQIHVGKGKNHHNIKAIIFQLK